MAETPRKPDTMPQTIPLPATLEWKSADPTKATIPICSRCGHPPARYDFETGPAIPGAIAHWQCGCGHVWQEAIPQEVLADRLGQLQRVHDDWFNHGGYNV